MARDAAPEHLEIPIPVAMDLPASPAQPECRDNVAAFRDRLEPGLEVPWRSTDVDPLVSYVLDRQDVVVVTDFLQANDPADRTL